MDSKYIAPYIIRLYVWELLKVNLGFKDTDYDLNGDGKGFIPIVPLGEEPELTNFKKPYLVYGYAESPVSDARMGGNIMFAVYSTEFRDLSTTSNLIARAFETDDAATHVNEFSSTIPAFIGIRFGNIELAALEGGTPEESSGGRMSAVVNLKYDYTADYDIVTSFAEWNGTKYTRLQ